MIMKPNHKVSIYRGNTYSTMVDANISVYIYEQSDTQDAINGVE